MSQEQELWTNKDTGRQFLIPKTVSFPPGDFILVNRNDKTIRTQEAHAAQFEAAEQELEEFMQAEIQEALAQVGQVFKGLFDLGKQAFSGLNLEDSEEESSDSSSEEESSEEESSELDTDDIPENVFEFEGLSENA